VRDGKAVEVPVTPGTSIADLTAIAGEVKASEKAVLRPAPEVKNGTLLKPTAK
jgi:hypothetical protein